MSSEEPRPIKSTRRTVTRSHPGVATCHEDSRVTRTRPRRASCGWARARPARRRWARRTARPPSGGVRRAAAPPTPPPRRRATA
eukprot:244879-Prymnesium_polylepis.1